MMAVDGGPSGTMAAIDPSAQAARERIRAAIDRLYREGIVYGDNGFSRSLYPTSVTPGRGKFLGDLVRQLKPAATLEVGMGWGLSTLHILEAMFENGGVRQPHIIMDPFQQKNYHNGALHVLREAGADQLVEHHSEPSEIFLPKLVEQGRQFDFAFIDGDHRFDGAFVDLVFVHKLLKPGGVMAVDDTELDAVHLACRFAETNWGYAYVGGHSDRLDKGPDVIATATRGHARKSAPIANRCRKAKSAARSTSIPSSMTSRPTFDSIGWPATSSRTKAWWRCATVIARARGALFVKRCGWIRPTPRISFATSEPICHRESHARSPAAVSAPRERRAGRANLLWVTVVLRSKV